MYLVYGPIIMVDKLTVEVQELREEMKRLRTPKNSGNSSLPSHDLFRYKNQSLREKSNKKSGGQPGHKGETLLMSPNPDKTIVHRPTKNDFQTASIVPDSPVEGAKLFRTDIPSQMDN